MTPGFYQVHKPAGRTSFSVLQEWITAAGGGQSPAAPKPAAPKPGVRPAKRPRLCHGGALDPFASGLLLILVGPATKLFDYLHAIPKIYHATIRWGTETDNDDPLGKPIATGDASGLAAPQLDEALAKFIGWQEQVPPATSNKRVDGERAYAKAHRGEEVNLPPSRVYLHDAKWISHDFEKGESEIILTALGGYYVRSLARDLGRALGCRGHLASLRRTAIGPYLDPGPEAPAAPEKTPVIRGRQLLPWAPARTMSDNALGEFRQKKVIPADVISPGEWKLPAGFPDPQAPIRAFHRDRLLYLLQPAEDGRLEVSVDLYPGV